MVREHFEQGGEVVTSENEFGSSEIRSGNWRMLYEEGEDRGPENRR